MAYDKNAGISQLAQVVTGRMKKESVQPTSIEFGTITSGYHLQTDSFPDLIPKTDYMVCRSLTVGKSGKEWFQVDGGSHGGHESGNGTHKHVIPVPEVLDQLKPGDRVLVLWMDAEAVVIDVVVPADSL